MSQSSPSGWSPKLLELRTRYLEEARDDVATLRGLLPPGVSELPTGDRLGVLRKLVHDLRGTGGTYGFHAISSWAAKAEDGLNGFAPAVDVAASIEGLGQAIEQARPDEPDVRG